ncbi:MAG: hypothetical protein GY854_16955 [Deltaproteobacteria bacterium]|nr:hypothetical protein [Deltaproteobacteria bacterium]
MRRLLWPVIILIGLAFGACGPGVVEGELLLETDEAECKSAIDGLGEECSLDGKPCRCGHICGEEPFAQNEDYLTHYCYTECNSMDVNQSCPSEKDMCLPLGPLEDVEVCLPTGVLETQEWAVPISHPWIVPVDISFFWGGEHHDTLQATASVTNKPEQKNYVVLTFAGEDDEDSIWYVQVQVLREYWNRGTNIAMVDPETNLVHLGPVFRARPFSAKLFRERDDRVWIEAIAVDGQLHIEETGDSCESPEDCGVAKGTVGLTFAGYRAEIDVTKFPPGPGSLILPPGIENYKNIVRSSIETDNP